MAGQLLGHMVVHGNEHGPQADYDGLIHSTPEGAQTALQDAQREFPAEGWFLAEVHESPTTEGEPQ